MPRRLHFGGKLRSEDWEVLDANPAPYVDHLGDASDLARFADNTFSAIYASHVVEHFDYTGALAKTLTEWRRVLIPGGQLWVSVPDLDVLAQLFLAKELTANERFFVMRMMFGGHVDQYDYHVVGLNQEFLSGFLHGCGYVNLRTVPSCNLFQDTSSMLFKGVAISLNMIAEKPGVPL